MQRLIQTCGRQIRWLALAAGVVLIPVGGLASFTVIGLAIGVPMLFISFALLRSSVQPQPCA